MRASYQTEKPDLEFLAADEVGDINANKYPADLFHQNFMEQANVIVPAFQKGIKELLF